MVEFEQRKTVIGADEKGPLWTEIKFTYSGIPTDTGTTSLITTILERRDKAQASTFGSPDQKSFRSINTRNGRIELDDAQVTSNALQIIEMIDRICPLKD